MAGLDGEMIAVVCFCILKVYTRYIPETWISKSSSQLHCRDHQRQFKISKR